MEAFEAVFEDAERWSGQYQRNNKRNNVKNLRCFPFCFEEHRTKSFCGQSVKVTLYSLEGHGSGISSSSLCAWAEFGRAEGTDRVTLGSTHALASFTALEHSRKNLSNPLFRGKLCEAPQREVEEVACFEFNEKRNGWNYSWTANTHTRKLQHCLHVYLFEKSGGGRIMCVGVFRSPEFRIVSLFARRSQKKLRTERSGIGRDPAYLSQKIEDMCAKQGSLVCDPEVIQSEDDFTTLEDISSFFIETMSTQEANDLFSRGAHESCQVTKHVNALLAPKRSKRARLERLSPHVDAPLTSLDRAFPLRKVRKTDVRSKWCWPSEIPPTALAKLLARTVAAQDDASAADRKLWRICVVLTIMESHWAEREDVHEEVEPTSAVSAKAAALDTSGTSKNNEAVRLTDANEEEHDLKIRKAVNDLCSHLTGETQLLLMLTHRLRELGVEARPETRRILFVDVVLSYVDTYLAENGLELCTFCRAFALVPSQDILSLAEERLKDVLFFLDSFSSGTTPICGTSLEETSANGLLSQIDVYLYGQDLSMAGLWRSDEDVAYHLDVVREHFLGANWLVRRLLRYIESMMCSEVLDSRRIRFSVHTKLFRVADFIFIADGRVHEYHDNLFLAPMSRPLVKSYRFTVDYQLGTLTTELFHNPHGQTKLLRRVHRPTKDNPRKALLEVEFCKINENTGAWEVMYHGTGYAIRVD